MADDRQLASGADHFRILFVCTGNICRSPLAERLTTARLRAALGPDAGALVIVSAGTDARAGEPIHPASAAVLRRLGGNPDGFVAQSLSDRLLSTAHLVLTATRAHRAAAVAQHPRAAGRTFTLREFSALAGAVAPATLGHHLSARDRAAALVEEAAALRGYLPMRPPEDHDVPDPYGRPAEAHDAAGHAVAEALEGPLALIAGDLVPATASTPAWPAPGRAP